MGKKRNITRFISEKKIQHKTRGRGSRKQSNHSIRDIRKQRKTSKIKMKDINR